MTAVEQNRQTVLEWVESVENLGDLTRLHDLATPEYAQLYTERRARALSAFADFRLAVHEIIAEDDKVSIVWEANAVHQGNWRGVPANVKPVMWRGMTLYYFREGKIAEEITSWNRLDMYEQLVGLPDWYKN